ncbi:MAG: hypothetical protein K9I70_01140 [Chitinophagaceae bacterium]|nr:hypothetical protein [Chitinophagaceae bacterium]
MKIKILSAVFFMLMSFMYEAQGGSLQFNQVLTYNGTLMPTNANMLLSQTYTCPSGKVWKIEGKTRTPLTVVLYSASARLEFYINGISFQDNYGNAVDTAPVWLKSGDNIYFGFTNGNYSNGNTASWTLSIIEYNIVP